MSQVTADNISAIRDLIEDDQRLTIQEIGLEVVFAMSLPKISSEIISASIKSVPLGSEVVVGGKECVYLMTLQNQEWWVKNGERKTKPASSWLIPLWLINVLGDYFSTWPTHRWCCLLLPAVGGNQRCSQEQTTRCLHQRQVAFLHDNAKPHTVLLTKDKLEYLHWKNLNILHAVQIYHLMIMFYLRRWKMHLEGSIQQRFICWCLHAPLADDPTSKFLRVGNSRASKSLWIKV